ncbi:MAG: hypothetical protein Q8S15_08430 [Erysipelotrichaceae bacterium]|nr:hypothetical protein [Erysipelotrichaceae bacterium]
MKNSKLETLLYVRRISKLQLALKTGINPSSLYDAINGKREFYPGYKRKVAEFLEVDENYLFSNDEPV